MKIAIDCRALRKSPSGIPNFLVSAINGFATENPEWQLYLLSNEAFHPELQKALVKQTNIQIIISPLPLLNKISFFWLIFKVYRIINKIRPDVYWAPAFLLPPFIPKETKTLVTVHDMVYKVYPNTMSFTNRWIFKLLHDWSINKADLLWANSEYTKKGIEEFFPERKCKTIFTGFFINTSIFRPANLSSAEKQMLLEKYKIGDKFILFVGTLEPRENLVFLLSLVPELAVLGFTFLIIGANGWGETNIKKVVEAPEFPKDYVNFAGFASTDDLVKLYSLAAVYVSTSLNEGFGMPQLEAMACGCPVVSPHNSAMIEVVSGSGETVKSWEKEDWVNTIRQVSSERLRYAQEGFAKVRNYETQTVIEKLKAYIQN